MTDKSLQNTNSESCLVKRWCSRKLDDTILHEWLELRQQYCIDAPTITHVEVVWGTSAYTDNIDDSNVSFSCSCCNNDVVVVRYKQLMYAYHKNTLMERCPLVYACTCCRPNPSLFLSPQARSRHSKRKHTKSTGKNIIHPTLMTIYDLWLYVTNNRECSTNQLDTLSTHQSMRKYIV